MKNPTTSVVAQKPLSEAQWVCFFLFPLLLYTWDGGVVLARQCDPCTSPLPLKPFPAFTFDHIDIEVFSFMGFDLLSSLTSGICFMF